jgi:aspartyl-tRNA(Asn)/glutamyl-tRNA(Gln) amidotransferase subunit C
MAAIAFSVTFVDMQLTPQMVDKLAQLSKLTFTNEQKIAITADLEQMIAFVEKLQELDTTGVPPLMHMSDTVNVLRADEVQPSAPVQQVLQNAPHSKQDFFCVPKVIVKPQ